MKRGAQAPPLNPPLKLSTACFMIQKMQILFDFLQYFNLSKSSGIKKAAKINVSSSSRFFITRFLVCMEFIAQYNTRTNLSPFFPITFKMANSDQSNSASNGDSNAVASNESNQGEQQQQQQQQQESPWKGILFRIFIFWFISNLFRGRQQPTQQGPAFQPATNLFKSGDFMVRSYQIEKIKATHFYKIFFTFFYYLNWI